MRARRFPILVALATTTLTAEAFGAPKACLVPEGVRVRAKGGEVSPCATELRVGALREEHVALQVVVEASDEDVDGVTVDVQGEGFLTFETFSEHFVEVERRSNTSGSAASLAFTAAARPADDEMLGSIPDALIPTAFSPAWAPYPARVRAGSRIVFFLEAFVPSIAAATTETHTVVVARGEAPIAKLELVVDIASTKLAYQAAPAFVFYDRSTLEDRFQEPDRVEKGLVVQAHAHHLDTITTLTSEADVARLTGSFSGLWFMTSGGYTGPGVGMPTSVVAEGAYGALGAPDASKADVVAAMSARLPPSVEDVFVYAVDETCKSTLGPGWRLALDEEELTPRVKVLHTCHEDPTGQDVDIVMMPAQAFDPDRAREAQELGKRVWVYNGMLPHAGSLALDVPLGALTVNGWLAASFGVERWFYWESIFWNDSNRGGRGPVDVFQTAETFHNTDGDTMLYDGLLFYPGRMPRGLDAHDLGRDAVLPSLRLKALRRGLEDAGLLALAAQVDPARAYATSRRIVGAAFDEAGAERPSALELDGYALLAAREELRQIVQEAPDDALAGRAAVRRGIGALAELRFREREARPIGALAQGRSILWVFALGGGLMVFGAAVAVAAGARRSVR